MSIILRGILVIMMIIFCSIIIIYQRNSRVGLSSRCSTFLLMLAWMSPIMDLGFGALGFPLSGFNGVCWIFLLVNKSILNELPNKIKNTIFILLLIYIISSIFSKFPVEGMLHSIDRATPLIVFAAAWTILKNQKKTVITKIFVVISVYAIIWGCIQQFISRDFSLYYINRIESNRIIGIFSEPQTAGCAFAILSLFFFNQFMAIQRTSYLTLSVILLIMGLLTGSKTCLFGIISGIVVSLFFYKVRPGFLILSIIIGAAILTTQDLWLNLPVFERMKDMDSSYDVRSKVYWASGLMIFYSNLITGIGIGNFLHYNELYVHLTYPGDRELATQPESGYLLLLDETGCLSLWYVFILLYIILKRGRGPFNISLIIPWLLAFVSVYNLESTQLQFILYLVFALIIFASTSISSKHIITLK